jgi:cyclase
LLLENGELIKTVNFKRSKYVGDPINAVRIFNEKGVDELMVLDIDATMQGREPHYGLIANLAAECRMPFCYGGGVTRLDQIERLIGLGVEKVAMSAAAIADSELVAKGAKTVGGQSIVVVIDVARSGRGYEVVTHRATRRTGLDAIALARRMQGLGAGEIVVNSVDRDGKMEGYDMDLVREVLSVLDVPMTFLGGAGSPAHIGDLFRTAGVVGAAAGSLFVFKGVYRAVLINYPAQAEKEAIFATQTDSRVAT